MTGLGSIFNFSNRKVGGLRFIKLGRITITLSVTSWETIEKRLEDALVKAVDEALWWDEEINSLFTA